jgi:hypothetical protein
MTTSSDSSTGFLAERPEPEKRVWALKEARGVLITSKGAFGGNNEVSPIDLVSLSKYILTGEDPYAVVTDAQPQ